MKNHKRHSLNQEGIVSIVVTMIIMIVLSLIVTGFAQLARREQREALDRQLSTQASYAAESGINALKQALPYIAADSRTDCNDPTLLTSGAPIQNPFEAPNISDNAGYTCLLFNRKLEDLRYQNVNSTDAVVAPLALQGSDGQPQPLNNLTIQWKAKNGSTTVNNSALGSFPNVSTWVNSIGILRLDLIPLPDTGSIVQADIDTNTKSFLLQPQSNSGSSSSPIGAISNGSVVGVKCNNGCSFTLSGLTLQKYYLRMRSIYNASDVTLNNKVAGNTTATTTERFTGAQIEIDSTGRAADVLKRVKVRIEDPSTRIGTISTLTFPEYTFSSSSAGITKRLCLAPAPAISTDNCN